jgi:hypothetical protein
MATPELWLELLSWTKALFDSTKATIDFVATVQKYKNDRATIQEANRVSVSFSTYDDSEIEALVQRMQQCRGQFAAEGGGEQRVKCICNVLNTARIGNGGTLPEIDDWKNIYSQLGCSRLEVSKGTKIAMS